MVRIARIRSHSSRTEVEQTICLKVTLTMRSDRLRERFDVTREPCGSPCGRQRTAKFEFKSPSVHSWFMATLPPKVNFAKLGFAKCGGLLYTNYLFSL